MQHILENAHRFLIKANSYIDEVIFVSGTIEEFKVYEKMLATLIFTINSKTEDEHLMKFMTYLILKNSMPFTNHYRILYFKYFINHPFMFSEEET